MDDLTFDFHPYITIVYLPSKGTKLWEKQIHEKHRGRTRVCCLCSRTGTLSVLPDISGARQVSIVVTQPPSRVREHDPKARVNCCRSKNLGLELPESIGTVMWNHLTERWFSFPALCRSNERLEWAHVGVLPRKQTAHSK